MFWAALRTKDTEIKDAVPALRELAAGRKRHKHKQVQYSGISIRMKVCVHWFWNTHTQFLN